MIIKQNSRLVMTGDSITDCGRNRGALPCASGSFGEGYVHLVYASLLAFAPEANIMVVNRGIGGDTTADLLSRWDTDVMEIKPEYISIMIGINDVWRHFDSAIRQCDLISPERFHANYRQIMERSLPQTQRIFLMSPVMFEINESEPMFQKTQEYACIVQDVAAEYGQIFVDCQTPISRALKSQHPYMYAQDRVHPNLAGHMLIARALLDAIGLYTACKEGSI